MSIPDSISVALFLMLVVFAALVFMYGCVRLLTRLMSGIGRAANDNGPSPRG